MAVLPYSGRLKPKVLKQESLVKELKPRTQQEEDQSTFYQVDLYHTC